MSTKRNDEGGWKRGVKGAYSDESSELGKGTLGPYPGNWGPLYQEANKAIGGGESDD